MTISCISFHKRCPCPNEFDNKCLPNQSNCDTNCDIRNDSNLQQIEHQSLNLEIKNQFTSRKYQK